MDRKVIFAIVSATIFSLSISAVVIAPSGMRNDPLPDHKFIVEIDGIASSGFTLVEGVRSTTEVIEYREGNENDVRYLPGLTRVGALTLQRGLTENSDLWEWYEEFQSGLGTRRAMSIIILDHSRNERVRFNLQECFPAEYGILPLDSTPGGTATEEIVVACERVDWA
jgi:phage tail-like protein